jgi:hypothetical protein
MIVIVECTTIGEYLESLYQRIRVVLHLLPEVVEVIIEIVINLTMAPLWLAHEHMSRAPTRLMVGVIGRGSREGRHDARRCGKLAPDPLEGRTNLLHSY